MHAVPKDSETHFKVCIVSDVFKGKRLVQKHRVVNELCKEEFGKGLHALSILAYSPEEWEAKASHEAPKSPKCLGGSKAEKTTKE